MVVNNKMKIYIDPNKDDSPVLMPYKAKSTPDVSYSYAPYNPFKRSASGRFTYITNSKLPGYTFFGPPSEMEILDKWVEKNCPIANSTKKNVKSNIYPGFYVELHDSKEHMFFKITWL
jgi:hypothetical protein